MEQQLLVFTDGGAIGNPGPAAVAFVVKDNQGKVLAEKGKYLGRTTNNVAEYTAVIEALKWIKNNLNKSVNAFKVINFFLDSRLVVNQLNGLFKVKEKKLRELVVEVRKEEQGVGGNVFYQYVPRQKNQRADFLVHQFMPKLNP